MIINKMLEPCPNCKEGTVLELYAGFEPFSFNTVEKYIYHCKKCGRTVKRLRNLYTKEPDQYFEINFKEI